MIVRHDGIDFRCEVAGAAGAPWVVFSNSLLTDLSLWDDAVAALGGAWRVLRYDQRGHGGTAVPETPATLAQLADDALALMAHFGVEGAAFVGCSMGAATGFALAPAHPDRIARLVASDGQAATAPGGAAQWAARIEAARAEGMPAFVEATLGRWFSARSRAEGNPALARVRAMAEATPPAGFEACARALQAYDVTAGLTSIRQPTLLVAGAEDGAMPATMQALAARIPDARFMAIDDAGHLPCIERPAAFNSALLQALA